MTKNFYLLVSALGLLLCLHVKAGDQLSNFLIPKKVHFVWMGNRLPHKYLNNIRSFSVRNRDYEFNVWVDRKSNFEVPQNLQDSGRFPIRVRDLSDEVSRLPVELQAYFERERNGVFPNYAAASDIIRAQILLDEGGIYFDTDVFMSESVPAYLESEKDFADQKILDQEKAIIAQKKEVDDFFETCKKFKVMKYAKVPQIGIIEFGLPHPDPAQVQAIKLSRRREKVARDFLAPVSRLGDIYAPFGFKLNVILNNPSGEIRFNNNVIAAVQNSFFLKRIQKHMIERYKRYEASPIVWEQKRFDPEQNTRFNYTLYITGPEVFSFPLGEVYFYLSRLSDDTLDSIVSEFPGSCSQFR